MDTSGLNLEVQDIVIKYGLKEKQDGLLAQLKTEQNLAIRTKIYDTIPVQILSNIILNLKKNTTTPEEVGLLIKASFGFSDERSKEMVKDVLQIFEVKKQRELEMQKEFKEETATEEKLKREKEQLKKTAQEKEAQAPEEKNVISDIPSLQKPITPPAPKKEAPKPNLDSFGKDPYKEIPSEEELKSKFYSL